MLAVIFVLAHYLLHVASPRQSHSSKNLTATFTRIIR